MFRALAVGLVFGLTACGGGFTSSSGPKVVKSDDVTVISQSATRRAVFFKNVETDYEKICMSAPPDSANSYEEGASILLPAAGGTTGVSEGAGRSALALGGRSPSALITREILYRTCELMLNMNASPEKMEEVFFKAMSAVIIINGAQLEDGTRPYGFQVNIPSSGLGNNAKPSDDDDLDDEDINDNVDPTDDDDNWPVRTFWPQN